MKKIFFYLSLAVFIFSCGKKNATITIKGSLVNGNEKYIYLNELLINGLGKTDSVQLSGSGSFKFKRPVDYPSFFSLRVNKSKAITLLAMPGEKIKITGNAGKLFETYKLSGSEESAKCQMLAYHLTQTQHSLDSINQVYKQYLNNKNIVNIRNMLTGVYDGFVTKEHNFVSDFVEKNPKSFSSILALYEQIEANTFVLNEDSDLKYFEKVDVGLFTTYPKAPYVQTLHANVNEMREQQKVAKLKRMISDLGAKAPDFGLPTPKGDTIRLSSTRGKVVLLDFWASWCGPCREDNPNLVPIYKKYKSHGFEIFQVSLDKTKEAWTKAISEDHLTWINVSDLKYWQSPVAKIYNVDAIPSSFLLDKDGSIIAKGLKGEALDNKLAHLLLEK